MTHITRFLILIAALLIAALVCSTAFAGRLPSAQEKQALRGPSGYRPGRSDPYATAAYVAAHAGGSAFTGDLANHDLTDSIRAYVAVVKPLRVTGNISLNGAYGYQWVGDDDTYIGHPAADTVTITAGGVAGLTVNTSETAVSVAGQSVPWRMSPSGSWVHSGAAGSGEPGYPWGGGYEGIDYEKISGFDTAAIRISNSNYFNAVLILSDQAGHALAVGSHSYPSIFNYINSGGAEVMRFTSTETQLKSEAGGLLTVSASGTSVANLKSSAAGIAALTGSATTKTVTLGTTMPSANYAIAITETDSTQGTTFRVSNRTTTQFDVAVAANSGTVTFTYSATAY